MHAHSQNEYTQTRIGHWDQLTKKWKVKSILGGYYRERLQEVYSHQILPGSRVLELGCGDGSLLASVKPAFGVGVDFSQEVINMAKAKHPKLNFVLGDAYRITLDDKFDYIILSDIVNELWNVQTLLQSLHRYCTPKTRIVLNFYSRLWELPLATGASLGLTRRQLLQNWLTTEDMISLLKITNFEVIKRFDEFLFPMKFPLIASFFNRYLVKLWPLRFFALTNFLVARPKLEMIDEYRPSVSIIVPARNEAGNIPEIFSRLPDFKTSVELIFVEGHSKDSTLQVIEEQIKEHPEVDARVFVQTGVGKGDAVRLGFSKAKNECLMILDADLTVSPEDLLSFYDLLRSNRAEFVNGVRLVYPMEKEAMRFFNFLGNKFFSLGFSWLLGRSIKDTLCGTKVLWKSDYERIAANRAYFGDFDPFGDFDLIFGASRLNLAIMDLPIRYGERTYGSTNIERWKHGWLLLRMLTFACKKLKFI